MFMSSEPIAQNGGPGVYNVSDQFVQLRGSHTRDLTPDSGTLFGGTWGRTRPFRGTDWILSVNITDGIVGEQREIAFFSGQILFFSCI